MSTYFMTSYVWFTFKKIKTFKNVLTSTSLHPKFDCCFVKCAYHTCFNRTTLVVQCNPKPIRIRKYTKFGSLKIFAIRG